MRRRERDFVALFNAIWYRSFPIASGHEGLGKRAVWTMHIGSVVKQCADFMGFFTCFESGGRTDAVIQKASGEVWAKFEWEWRQPYHYHVNELKKLAKAAQEAKPMVFIGYSKDEDHDENIETIRNVWRNIKTPLIVFLITYHWAGGRRCFDRLQTHYFRAGVHRKVHEQFAHPWDVKDTVWQILRDHTEPGGVQQKKIIGKA